MAKNSYPSCTSGQRSRQRELVSGTVARMTNELGRSGTRGTNLYDLMSTADKLEVVPLQEPCNHISSELSGTKRKKKRKRQGQRRGSGHLCSRMQCNSRGRTYGERDTPVVLAPSGDVLVRVRPEKIAEQSYESAGSKKDATSVWGARGACKGEGATDQCRERR